MSRHATPQPTGSPVRYGSRYGSEPAAGAEPQCLVCLTSLPSRRARYCSVACKQRAYRRRQIDVTATDADLLAIELKRLGELVAHTIYECPDCGAENVKRQLSIFASVAAGESSLPSFGPTPRSGGGCCGGGCGCGH